jgi:cysteine desulfurase
MKLPVYLDYNATTPCDPRVVEAMLPYFTENFGNAASRSHAYGWMAEEAINIAREKVARLINADPIEIVFTSGATEADNLALKGIFGMYSGNGNHILTVNTEHKAVLDACRKIEKSGGEITCLKVNKDGLIDLSELEAAIRPATVLIAVMYANNEIGVIQPIKEISEIAKKHDILFFSDAVQAVGKIPVDVKNDGIDLMGLSAHKMYGPKGVGALFIRSKSPGILVKSQIDGGGHEKGIRSGTLNVPGIVGFGKAAEIAGLEMQQESGRLRVLKDRLEEQLLELDGAILNGNSTRRLPHVTNISFGSVEGEDLLLNLAKYVAVSSGSACTSITKEPSHVLKSLGVDDALALSSIRFSLGRFTTDEEIDYAIAQVRNTVIRLRKAVK